MWLAEAILVLPTALKLQRNESAMRSGAPSPVNRLQRKQGKKNILLELQGREGIAFFCLAGIYFVIQTLTGRHHAILGPILEKGSFREAAVSSTNCRCVRLCVRRRFEYLCTTFWAHIRATSGTSTRTKCDEGQRADHTSFFRACTVRSRFLFVY